WSKELRRSGCRVRRCEDRCLVLREPLVEGIRRSTNERARLFDAADLVNLFFEVAIDLEHVAVFVGAGEAEAPEQIGVERGVLDRADSETLAQLLAHLVKRHVLAGDADSLADVL